MTKRNRNKKQPACKQQFVGFKSKTQPQDVGGATTIQEGITGVATSSPVSMPSAHRFGEFVIGQYLDWLTPAPDPKRPGQKRYVCPNCESNNLEIGKDGIKYACYTCQDTKAIARALGYKARGQALPQSTATANKRLISNRYQVLEPKPTIDWKNVPAAEWFDYLPIKVQQNLPVVPATIQLMAVADHIAPVHVSRDVTFMGNLPCRSWHFDYSTEDVQQFLRREELLNDRGERIADQKPRYTYRKWVNNRWQADKGGDKLLPPYQLSNCLSHCSNRETATAIAMLEGEGTADAFISATGLGATTLWGGDWGEGKLSLLADQLLANGLSLVYFPDNDHGGWVKAQRVWSTMMAKGVYCLVVDLSALVPTLPTKGDFKDMANGLVGELDPSTISSSWVQSYVDSVFSAHQFDSAAVVSRHAQPQGGSMISSPVSTANANTQNKAKIVRQRVGPGDVAAEFIEQGDGGLVYVCDRKAAKNTVGQWWEYQSSSGLWERRADDEVFKLARNFYHSLGISPSWNNLTETVRFMRLELVIPSSEFQVAAHLVPFANGVLDKQSNEFRVFQKSDWATNKLPWDYRPHIFNAVSREELEQSAGPLWQWLAASAGGEDVARLVCAFASSAIYGNTDHQKFLEVVGSPGSGKGTLTRVINAMLGQQNVAASSLHSLDTNRFELARVLDSRLLVCPDEPLTQVQSKVLEKLVGGDVIGRERKGEQQGQEDQQRFKGALLICAEQPINLVEGGGALRRRITINWGMRSRFKSDPKLIEKFIPYYQAFFDLLCSYTEVETSHFLTNPVEACPALLNGKIDATLNTSQAMQFLEDCCYYNDKKGEDGLPQLRTRIGISRSHEDGEEDSLYAEYRDWCNRTGQYKILNLATFSQSLNANLSNLNLGDLVLVKDYRVRTAKGSFMLALGVRRENSAQPRIVSVLYRKALMAEIGQGESDDGVTMNDEPQNPKTPGNDKFDNYYSLSQKNKEMRSKRSQDTFSSSFSVGDLPEKMESIVTDPQASPEMSSEETPPSPVSSNSDETINNLVDNPAESSEDGSGERLQWLFENTVCISNSYGEMVCGFQQLGRPKADGKIRLHAIHPEAKEYLKRINNPDVDLYSADAAEIVQK